MYTAVSRVRRFTDVRFEGNVSDDWLLASERVVDFEAQIAADWLIVDNSQPIV